MAGPPRLTPRRTAAPPVDTDVIDRDAPLRQHFLDIFVRQAVVQVPSGPRLRSPRAGTGSQ